MVASALSEYDRRYIEQVTLGSELLHSDSDLVIYSIQNRWAADFWFFETAWCVKASPWFEDYLKNGPMLLLRSNKRRRDYLLAPGQREFRNIRNRRVSLAIFVNEHPSAYLPLRLLGVFWLPQCTRIGQIDKVIYCPPH